MKNQNKSKSLYLYPKLKICSNEGEVRTVYEQGLTFYFSDDVLIKNHYGCDNYIDTYITDKKHLRLLVEYKGQRDLESNREIAKIIIQIIFYLKKFENAGKRLPNVIMVGVKEYCFVIHSNNLLSYLDKDVNWSIAPSSAYVKYPEVTAEIANDSTIISAVKSAFWIIDSSFDFKQVIDVVCDLCENVKKHVRITEQNISEVFNYFRSRVLLKKDLSANDQVSSFVGILTNDNSYYAHPKKKNLLVTPFAEIPINSENYTSFFIQYDSTYTPDEKRKLTSIMDRLIEDTIRRKQGAFFTPCEFVSFAYSIIEKELGENWRDDYVVYDPCAGSLNLTRDFHFNELYCSTLDKGELDLGSRYNQNAKKWVMDFLNDGDECFDKGLIKAFEQNKPIVFFINPPYGTAGNWLKENKTCTNNTVIRELMLKEKFGGSENLQHQFMYRITKLVEKYNLTNAYFALFSNPIWLSGAKQGVFLKNFSSRWECKDAYLFQASHFADVSDAWGISLTLWKANSNATPITEYKMKLIDMLDDSSIDVIGHHTIYNSYFYNKASDWVRDPIKTRKDKVELPNTTSGLLLDTKGRSQKGLFNQLGCIFSKSNSISLNQTCVAIFSIPYADGHSIPICSENFTRCSMLFTARKLIENTWINHADEYLAPNENHPDYKRFEVDSVVYSLFENKSNQTSLRQITYKGKLYDIPNEFFWMSKEEMKNLANTHHDDFMYDDASISKERYVFTLLQKPEIKKYLSKTAKQLLQIATELVIESMQYRTEFEADHPDHHIHCWDCGYYQLKNLWKQYLPDKFKKFRELYKQFGNELRPLVYELGFLRQ